MTRNSIQTIQKLLPRAMAKDRHAATVELSRVKRSGRQISEEKITRRLSILEKRLTASARKKDRRRANRPSFSDPDLPIAVKKAEIIDAIRKHSVVIISGETGSGKTTQIPKFCLAAGRGIDGKIGCTQPRRIAAISVANRIAEELAEPIGKSVGYKIRFQDKTDSNGFIKLMTDGILLAEAQGDPYLSDYDTLIVDEAHERSLNIDFILGLLKTLLKKRKDLKLIITSATIDTEKFSRAFDNAPIIEVSGRMYPVEVRYAEVDSNEDSDEFTLAERAAAAVDEIHRESPFGDILIFMPTEQDIRETCEILEGRKYSRVSILPLFARLSAFEQARVFSRQAGRKIIVSTNVAETSLTIPGIRYVVDTGLARISQYNPRSRTTALPVAPVSKSSADQRMGRCGRVENGICIRLFSRTSYESRPLFTLPEVLRSNLAEVILRMIGLNLGEIERFPFIDPPLAHSIKDGFDLLQELDAIEMRSEAGKRKSGPWQLTETGQKMAGIPLDPRLSRMLIEASRFGCFKEAAVIASALSIQDPRERPAERTDAADRAHAAFKDPLSDFIGLLNIWNKFHAAVGESFGATRMKKFCKECFLSFKRMREWRDIHGQIVSMAEEYGLLSETALPEAPKTGPFGALYTAIHKSILTGFLSNIAQKKEKYLYQGAKGKQVMLFPGSGIFSAGSAWIVAAELVETSRLFARTNAAIDNRWLEEIGGNQCRYVCMNPRWERNRQEVTATEQVSLYGLIIDQRPVSYGRFNPDEACDIFIRSALVQGDLKTPLPFMDFNRKRIDEVVALEDRIRRRDLLISEDDLFEFYRKRLDGVYDISGLKKAIQARGGDGFLRVGIQDLLRREPDSNELRLYPGEVRLGNRVFPCEYRFEPGQPQDGLTVRINQTFAGSVPPQAADWLVPGLLRDKIALLIKGLAKEYRRKLVPVAATAERIFREMPRQDVPLATALSRFISEHFGVEIPASAWSEKDLPEHLKMRIAITDASGKSVLAARDAFILKASARVCREEGLPESLIARWERSRITEWNFPDLPESVSAAENGRIKALAYPALCAGEAGISLKLLTDPEQASAAHRQGVAALCGLYLAGDIKYLRKKIVLDRKMQSAVEDFGGPRKFQARIVDRILQDLFAKNIRTRKEFLAHVEAARPRLFETATTFSDLVLRFIAVYQETRSAMERLQITHRFNPAAGVFYENLNAQLKRLVPENFLELYDQERLNHIERYLKALAIRAQRAGVNLEKDREKQNEVEFFAQQLRILIEALGPETSAEKRREIERFFWLLEEYKVSVFAQELRTPFPVSRKRLENQLSQIRKMA